MLDLSNPDVVPVEQPRVVREQLRDAYRDCDDSASQAINGEPASTVVKSDFGEIKFENDRQVFVIAHVGADTGLNSLLPPPQERFNSLANLTSFSFDSDD